MPGDFPADRPSTTPPRFLPPLAQEHPEIPLLALLAGGGAVLSRNTGAPERDMLRGGLKGLLLGGGAVAGAGLLNAELNTDPEHPNLEPAALGAAVGGTGGYLGGSALTGLLGLEEGRTRTTRKARGRPSDEDLLRLLSRRSKEAGAVERLRQAKRESDRGNYLGKHRIMRQLLIDSPQDFHVDSSAGDVVGLTHTSGFKVHLPRRVLPEGFAKEAAGVPRVPRPALPAGALRPASPHPVLPTPAAPAVPVPQPPAPTAISATPLPPAPPRAAVPAASAAAPAPPPPAAPVPATPNIPIQARPWRAPAESLPPVPPGPARQLATPSETAGWANQNARALGKEFPGLYRSQLGGLIDGPVQPPVTPAPGLQAPGRLESLRGIIGRHPRTALAVAGGAALAGVDASDRLARTSKYEQESGFDRHRTEWTTRNNVNASMANLQDAREAGALTPGEFEREMAAQGRHWQNWQTVQDAPVAPAGMPTWSRLLRGPLHLAGLGPHPDPNRFTPPPVWTPPAGTPFPPGAPYVSEPPFPTVDTVSEEGLRLGQAARVPLLPGGPSLRDALGPPRDMEGWGRPGSNWWAARDMAGWAWDQIHDRQRENRLADELYRHGRAQQRLNYSGPSGVGSLTPFGLESRELEYDRLRRQRLSMLGQKQSSFLPRLLRLAGSLRRTGPPLGHQALEFLAHNPRQALTTVGLTGAGSLLASRGLGELTGVSDPVNTAIDTHVAPVLSGWAKQLRPPLTNFLQQLGLQPAGPPAAPAVAPAPVPGG